MLELISMIYILQLFFMAMAGINIVIGIAKVLADGQTKEGSIMVVFGMLHAVVSMILGMLGLVLLK